MEAQITLQVFLVMIPKQAEQGRNKSPQKLVETLQLRHRLTAFQQNFDKLQDLKIAVARKAEEDMQLSKWVGTSLRHQ